MLAYAWAVAGWVLAVLRGVALPLLVLVAALVFFVAVGAAAHALGAGTGGCALSVRRETCGTTGRFRMTYEEYLDEVTTLITEKYGMDDEPAIQMVMRAQADDFFSGHDDDPAIRTLERAHEQAAQEDQRRTSSSATS